MSTLTFKEYVSALNENNKDCNFIKDPKLRKQCKKLMKRSEGGVRMYGSLSAPAGGGMSGGAAGGAA
ncbi:hypothetical protein LCGC14_2896070 [marine sediment metagenome]|uniref:Uncharacterized protein n=1 Tax=marine sediment metagenome TaxID=412755 RepID=A0A0F8YHK8_9ZZZZ